MAEAEFAGVESARVKSTEGEPTAAESSSDRTLGARDREAWKKQWLAPDGPLYGPVLVWAWQAGTWSKCDPRSLTEEVLRQFAVQASNDPRFDVVPKQDRKGNWGPERNPAIDVCGRIFHKLVPAVDSEREARATRCFLAVAAIALRTGVQGQIGIRRVAAADTQDFKDSFSEYLAWLAYRIHGPVDVVPRAWALVPLHAATVDGKPAEGDPPPILEIAGFGADDRHRNDAWWKAFTETCGQVLAGRVSRARAEAPLVTADLVADGKLALPLLREVLHALRTVEEFLGLDPRRTHRDLVWYGRLWLWLDLLREIAQLTKPRTRDDMRQKVRMVGSYLDALDWFDALSVMRRQGKPIDSIARTGIAPPIPLLWKPHWPTTNECPILRHAATGLFGPEYARAEGKP